MGTHYLDAWPKGTVAKVQTGWFLPAREENLGHPSRVLCGLGPGQTFDHRGERFGQWAAIISFEPLIAQGGTQGVRRPLRPPAIIKVRGLAEPSTGQLHFLGRFRLLNAVDQQLTYFVAQGAIAPDDGLNDPLRTASDAPCRLRITQCRVQKLQLDLLRDLSKLAQPNYLRVV